MASVSFKNTNTLILKAGEAKTIEINAGTNNAGAFSAVFRLGDQNLKFAKKDGSQGTNKVSVSLNSTSPGVEKEYTPEVTIFDNINADTSTHIYVKITQDGEQNSDESGARTITIKPS